MFQPVRKYFHIIHFVEVKYTEKEIYSMQFKIRKTRKKLEREREREFW